MISLEKLLYSDIYRPISFKLGFTIKTMKFYILVTLTFIQGHSCIRNQNLSIHFLANLCINLHRIQCVATTCLFVEAHAKFILHK